MLDAAGMSKARLVITAVIVEGRTVSEAARSYGVSRSWAYELVARYRSEGDKALEPRSRRPKNSPRRISDDTVELILTQRQELVAQGLDAGEHTIAWHLEHRQGVKVHPRRSGGDSATLSSSRTSRRSDPRTATSASRPTNPTRPGSPT